MPPQASNFVYIRFWKECCLSIPNKNASRHLDQKSRHIINRDTYPVHSPPLFCRGLSVLAPPDLAVPWQGDRICIGGFEMKSTEPHMYWKRSISRHAVTKSVTHLYRTQRHVSQDARSKWSRLRRSTWFAPTNPWYIQCEPMACMIHNHVRKRASSHVKTS